MRQAIGIVRRVDDLGRVVIPKEIRRLAKATRHNKCLECHHFCNGCDGDVEPCEAFEYAK